MTRVLDDCLAAHARRRAALVPTISLLVGDERASLAAIRRWASAEGRPVMCVEGISEGDVQQALLAQALRQEGLLAQALSCLASSLERPAEEVQRSLDVPRERELLSSSLELLPPRARAAFLVLTRESPQDQCLQDSIMGVLELFAPAWPCLLVPGPRSSAACLRQLEHWVEAAPLLPGIVVVNDALWSNLQSELQGSRLLGVLQEGLVTVDAVSATAAPLVQLNPGGRRLTGTEQTASLTPEAAAGVLESKGSLPEDRERARSAIEAFLFELLELRATTVGLFKLNVKLDFNHGSQRAEVDLCCASLRIALEVDGYHHFIDPVAVRRDRRKDLLLQRHGYLIMRVLAEDVVPDMAGVLECIEEVLAWRRLQVSSAP